MPDFEEVRDQFREQVLMTRMQAAESTFVSGITDPLGVQIQDGASEVVRELARDPERELGRRAASRALVSWQGGELSAGEVLQVVRFFQRQQRDALENADASLIDNLLERLADNEILVQEARNRGMTVSEPQRDSARIDLLTNLRQAVREAGLLDIRPQEGESTSEAIERRVTTLLGAVINQQQSPLLLGALSYALRASYDDTEVMERAFPAVVAKVEENRPAQPQLSPMPGQNVQPQLSPPAQAPPSQTPPAEQPQ